MTYANPVSANSLLQAGKITFPLIVFYAATINSASFRATLNGTDISRCFKPVPGGYQVVPLKLALGSNTLVVSVQGKTASGQGATDTDRLAFLVR